MRHWLAPASKHASKRGSAVSGTWVGFARPQLEPLEAEQSHSFLARRIGEIKLGHIRAFTLAGVGHREACRDRLAATDLEIAVGKARVAQSVTERIHRLLVLPRVPAVADFSAFVVADRRRSSPMRLNAGQLRP